MSAKLLELGIPEYEITPSVSIAVSGLLNHVEQLSLELATTRQNMEDLRQMVDVEGEITLPNRKAFISRLGWSIDMQRRYAVKTSVVVFKMNDFATIGKVYGTAASARAVKLTAEFISANLRESDYFCRLKPDEFGAIMYFAEYADVVTKCQSVTNDLRAKPLSWNNSIINLNLSFGVHLINTSDSAESALLDATNASFVSEAQKKFEEIDFKA